MTAKLSFQNLAMLFSLHACRFRFQAVERIHFPAAKSGNLLRGAFGMIFRRIAPAEVYERIFRPQQTGPGPSGFADPPRPFVFRASHLDGRTLSAGEQFEFTVYLFEKEPPVTYFTLAFEEFSSSGLGPARGLARLEDVDAQPVTVDLACLEPATRALVRFLTPTEFKSDGRIVMRPQFGVLMRRVRDRVGSLRGPFLPYLRAAFYTGVGRHTVWGNGAIETQVLE